MQKEDVIYRQAAIDAMADTLWHYPNECYKNLNSYEFAKALAELGLKSVPFAQSETIGCKGCKYLRFDNICKNDRCARMYKDRYEKGE